MNKKTNKDYQERLLPILESLEKNIERQNSLKFTLVRGVVYGLGVVIGSSALFAVFSSIFLDIFSTLG